MLFQKLEDNIAIENIHLKSTTVKHIAEDGSTIV